MKLARSWPTKKGEKMPDKVANVTMMITNRNDREFDMANGRNAISLHVINVKINEIFT